MNANDVGNSEQLLIKKQNSSSLVLTFFILAPRTGYGGRFTFFQSTGTWIFSYSWRITRPSTRSLENKHKEAFYFSEVVRKC